VERCWRVKTLSWGLGLFYLNRYFALFGHVPVVLQYFWSTSNPNKTKVNIYILLPSICGGNKLNPASQMSVTMDSLWYFIMIMISNDISIQLSLLGIVSWMPNHRDSNGCFLCVHCCEFLYDTANCKISPDIVLLVLRMYALYERSRKVLAFYIVVGVFFIPATCVSPNFSGG